MSLPRVVIVGAGFAGLAAAQALRKADADVILIDRTNHHVFQPLLYQVATSALAPAQIAVPIRGVLGKQRNTTVILGEVTGVDTARRSVLVNTTDRDGVPVAYDYLVLATGVRHSYFGHDEFETFAPGLKSLADAVGIRNRILRAFERAEAAEDPQAHRDLLTFVLVGAGPTGVEMAGAIAVLVRTTLRAEFRRIDPAAVRIVLLDRAPRVLGTFSEDLSQAAQERLKRLGVELRLGVGADRIDEDGVVAGGERIAAKTVIWTAGVAPSPAGKWLNATTDRAGRVLVGPDLTVLARPEIFVAPHRGAIRAAAVSVFGQGHHGGGGERICRNTERKVSRERRPDMARLARSAPVGARATEPALERFRAVDVDARHRPARLTPHREPRRGGGSEKGRVMNFEALWRVADERDRVCLSAVRVAPRIAAVSVPSMSNLKVIKP